MKRVILGIVVLMLAVPFLTADLSYSIAAVPFNIMENGSPPDDALPFETAWQNYKTAFQPVIVAINTGNYESLRDFLPHLKDCAVTLKKSRPSSDAPADLVKLVKKVLSGTKQLVKAARSGQRGKIQEAYEHLKDAFDKVEVLRNRHQ